MIVHLCLHLALITRLKVIYAEESKKWKEKQNKNINIRNNDVIT